MKPLSRQLIFGCVLLALLLSLWSRAVTAAPSLVDPRINRLESQVRSLQSQVTRLQSQLPRAGGRQPMSNAPPAPDQPSLDQQFDHLAILIIELQERVSRLEENVASQTAHRSLRD